jgi:NADPH:quinone reductase-like Zn-dependent oxidoreductase
LGGFSEYASVSESALAPKPANRPFEAAAAVPIAALTALQGLRDKGKIQTGQQMLINGASCAMGTFAVQLAKAFGTKVTGVSSRRNLDLARSRESHRDRGVNRTVTYTKCSARRLDDR